MKCCWLVCRKSLFCAADNEINRLPCTHVRWCWEAYSRIMNPPPPWRQRDGKRYSQTKRTCSESRKEEALQSTCSSLSFFFVQPPSLYLVAGKSLQTTWLEFAGLSIFYCKKVQSYKLPFLGEKRRSPILHRVWKETSITSQEVKEEEEGKQGRYIIFLLKCKSSRE